MKLRLIYFRTEFSWSDVTVNCCMCEGGSHKSGAISFLLPQQQSRMNPVLAHLEGGNKVCVCVLKELILSCFAGEMRKCLYPSGTTNQATALYSHSSFSVSPSLSHSLSPSLSFFHYQCFYFWVKACISQSLTKFSLLYFHPSFKPPEIWPWLNWKSIIKG